MFQPFLTEWFYTEGLSAKILIGLLLFFELTERVSGAATGKNIPVKSLNTDNAGQRVVLAKR
jgi:hypothetical protein